MNQSETGVSFGEEYLRPKNTARGNQRKPDYWIPEEPKLTPTYGCRAWSRESSCEHVHPHGPIPSGSRVYPECCSKTGIENHPIFHRDALDRNGDRQWVQGGSRKAYRPGEHAGGTGPIETTPTNRESREEQDQLFLALNQAGWTPKVIAKKFEVKPVDVKAGIARARVVAAVSA